MSDISWIRRRLRLSVVLVTLGVGALTGIVAAGPAAAQSTKSVQTARCTKAATGRSNLTKANVSDCRSLVVVQLRCDSGPSIGIIRVKGVVYALRQGSRPIRMGNNYRVLQLAKLCISPPPPTTTTTTRVPTTTTVPPTTTTVTVPPTTTAPAPPPTTAPPPTSPPPTAAPASACSPTTSSGNCYSAGEFCSDADHGLSGVAGDGQAITCEDNNGWRWEPS
jgi:hypothetical protein